ncbi:hypothetical protein MVEN_01698700 [Mycena venus]|uniref:Uncharacterized protein n=1 Tax=Mycena venus TaxID=2733690 RepID=A0A8H6XPP0_9AGAR|nr:hypothetical protein MVEN_01698700 [Mycena venus]
MVIHISRKCFSGLASMHTSAEYISLVCGRPPHWSDYTPWIRPSTGVLSIELTPPASWAAALVNLHSSFPTSTRSLLSPPPTSEIIGSISLVDYHRLCNWCLYWERALINAKNLPVQLGSICHASGLEFERSFEVAFSPNFKVIDGGWSRADPNIQDNWEWITFEEGTSILENGWIRVNSACVAHEYQRRVSPHDVCSEGWLAEANHIFNSLDIRTNHQDYFLVYGIDCRLQMLGPIENLPPSYLFLCPWTEFETNDPGRITIPESPGYWSMDPSGVARLSAEEARGCGLPDISTFQTVWAYSWDTEVHAGIRQFHEAKGFDPNSQDVAIELGYPLFQVSCARDDLLAHLREIDTDNDYPESDGMSDGEDYNSISADADMEMVSLGDLDGDNQFHQERLEEEEVSAMVYC